MAEHVIVNFYKVTAVFVTMLRNCINDLAWDKLANYKLLLDIETSDSDSHLKTTFSKNGPPLYTATKSACVD